MAFGRIMLVGDRGESTWEMSTATLEAALTADSPCDSRDSDSDSSSQTKKSNEKEHHYV